MGGVRSCEIPGFIPGEIINEVAHKHSAIICVVLMWCVMSGLDVPVNWKGGLVMMSVGVSDVSKSVA